jgi:hypothetical protein
MVNSVKDLKKKEYKHIERFRHIIRLSLQPKEVYTGEEVFAILEAQGVL